MNRNKGIQKFSIFITVLALTVLSCQGVAGFNPFATATPTPTLPVDFVTRATEGSLKRQGATLVPNQELAAKNAHGVEIGSFEYKQTAPTASGASVQVHAKALTFHAGDNLIMIQLAVPKQFAKELLPVMSQIKDSVQLIES